MTRLSAVSHLNTSAGAGLDHGQVFERSQTGFTSTFNQYNGTNSTEEMMERRGPTLALCMFKLVHPMVTRIEFGDHRLYKDR